MLFVCTGNAGRSQIAQAMCRALYGDAVEVQSAGVDPWKDLHPMARELMAERGEELAGHYPKHVRTLTNVLFDIVVTIGERAAKECPAMRGAPARIHWALPDPADAARASELENAFRATLADIERLLPSLPL